MLVNRWYIVQHVVRTTFWKLGMKKKYILYPAIVFLWSLLFVLLFYFNRSPIFLFIAAGINAFLVPLAYFLCIKGTRLSNFSVLYVLILGLKIASFILSKTSYAAFSLGNHILSGVIILLIWFGWQH